MNKDLFELIVMVGMLVALLAAAPYFFLKAASERYAKAYAKRVENLALRSIRRTARLAFVRLPRLLLGALAWLGRQTRALVTRLLG